MDAIWQLITMELQGGEVGLEKHTKKKKKNKLGRKILL